MREPPPLLVEFLVIDVALPTVVAELLVWGNMVLVDGRVERRTITMP